jgi:hypothetical protein
MALTAPCTAVGPMGLGACDETVTGPLSTGIYKGR